MKHGFTMIELIFIIVILGILAAVAIPKLTAVHDEQNALPTEQEVLPPPQTKSVPKASTRMGNENPDYPNTIYSSKN